MIVENRWMEMVREFQRVYNRPERITIGGINDDTVALRLELIDEEFKELREACEKQDIVELADALGDLIYVVVGVAVEFGIPLDAVLEEIHSSNMSKLGSDGIPLIREDGKVLKGPNFRPPDLGPILEKVLK